jgi:hypothetical protein
MLFCIFSVKSPGMKYILLLFATLAYGQGKTVVVYGRVTSAYNDVAVESGDIELNYDTSDGSYLTFESIGKDGYYARKLTDILKVEVATYYDNYYDDAVVAVVGNKDSIRIDFVLKPKPFVYTSAQAVEDTRNNRIQLVTFDSLEYNWTRKINMKKDFGFDYVLLQEPEDYNFVKHIQDYNRIVEGYLTSKDGDWETKLNHVRDSVVNLEADDYGKKHDLDLKNLKVPSFAYLPKIMQEKVTMWQQHYNSWYKDDLKDFTIAYTLKVIKSDKEYEHFYLLPERISMDYEALLPELIKLLTDPTEVGMEGYSGFMFCRGLAPTGPIGCVAIPYSDDDLFTVAGRANFLLKRLTWEDFGNVLPNPDKEWLKKLQNRWAYWLLQLQEK